MTEDSTIQKTRANTPTSTVENPDSSAAVQTQNLSMRFGRTQALNDMDLTVMPGSIYALVGPNGAGKTTLIKLLVNIIRPTSGVAYVFGTPSTVIAGEALSRIGYVSENQELPEWMTVSYLLSYLRPFYPTWDIALEQQLVSQFDIPCDRKLKYLSRGQRMKAALLSVLPYRPALIILDEPFSGLDPLVRDELIEGLLERSSESTILLSSHDLAEIESFATHIGFIDSGRLLFSEEVAILTRRFREVTVTLAPNTSESNLSAAQSSSQNMRSNYPSSWLLPERAASVFQFIHSQANTESVQQQIADRFPSATAVELEPMSLRSIFLALAKTSRMAQSKQADPLFDWSRA